MKIVKPLTLGLLHQPYRHRGAHRLAIAALGFFALGRDDERYLIENLQWPKALSQLPAGQPLDHVLPKARAEVALAGCAHAPTPAQAVDVRLCCGPVDKRLRVYGDRAWRRTPWGGICVDPAAPFVRMPLVPERTWGGAGHDNPLGLGHLAGLGALRVRKGAMPNIDYPEAPGGACALPGRRRHPAAGFLPQQLRHAERRRRASGTYDRRWLEEDFPGLPRDFDFGLYNLTAEDQQFRGAFAGGEAYRLEGLSADGEAIGGTLPAVAARAWVLSVGQGADAAREVALHCDTVWFFPEVGLGLAIHRGQTEVEDAMAQDVAALMLGYDAGERLRDAEHYRAVLAQRLDPQQAAFHAFDESQLAPVRSARAEAARAAAREREARAASAQRQRVLDGMLDEFRARSGLEVDPVAAAPALASTLPPLPAIPAQALEECDFDLAELQARARALAAQAQADADRRMAELQAQLPPVPEQAAADPRGLREAALARVRTPAPDLQPRTQADTAQPLPPELAEALAMAERAQPGAVDPAQMAEAQAALAQLPALRRAGRNAAPQPAVPAPPDDPALPRLLGREALRLRAAGESLAGRDLSDVDLRDADLRGADLREVQLERADLRGADLRDADLRGAVLTAANLDGADLSGADLSGANLCAGTARAARMAGVCLDRVRAFDADWSGADLREARADGALLLRIALADACLDGVVFVRSVLMQARAPRSRWVGARWRMCVAPSADFAEARFDGARLQRSVLMDADLRRSVWQGATLHTVYCGGSTDWRAAQLGLLHATKCGWRGARLAGADLAGATLASCDLGAADLEGACLRDAQLHRSLFLRSRLCGVDAAGASFFQAMCRQADFSGADLRNAVLVQADLAEARLRDVRMDGARIDKIAGAA